LLQIYFRLWECKIYQNQLRFSRVIDKSCCHVFLCSTCSKKLKNLYFTFCWLGIVACIQGRDAFRWAEGCWGVVWETAVLLQEQHRRHCVASWGMLNIAFFKNMDCVSNVLGHHSWGVFMVLHHNWSMCGESWLTKPCYVMLFY